MNNKRVVITGAGSGIGRELALQFAAKGCQLALADVNSAGLDATVTLARAEGASQIISAAVNVADEAQFNDFAQSVNAQLGGVDVVINNAGITRFGEFASTSAEAFRSVLDVNFWGVVHGSRAFLPALRSSRGSLVNISSLFGLIGVAGQAHYCASKFAVRGFTESLRQELKEDGVHVACVHPGGVRTGIASNATFDQAVDNPADVVRNLEEKALKLAPSEAARIIIDGIERRRERILVGGDAKFVDLLQRLFPRAYADIVQRVLGKASNMRKKVTA
ncbi:SDR family oxidoreductase [Aquipseudomonas ullengensis]|uniref:SDR family oxidoreductase n=1 Tax=Aquipseudomonas ullengensis TaxID=2759166 RepID=A0A7W4LLA7_9GAMM|nr:SDR family oxidoreductase [Pseudomonas ullengensis]MBB2495265.1 SDR family oxidoreductase [Pseudomonas ullengensis]